MKPGQTAMALRLEVGCCEAEKDRLRLFFYIDMAAIARGSSTSASS
jgi:hypothetical protein